MKTWLTYGADMATMAGKKIFPPTCAICHNPGQLQIDLCAECYSALEQINRPCQCCGLPLRRHHKSDICHSCQLFPQSYDRVLAPFHYSGITKKLIQQTKYQRRLANTRILAKLLLEHIDEQSVDALIAAPAHSGTLGKRGYNQALEIARDVSRATGVVLLTEGCIKVRSTAKQAGLDASGRKHNLAHAFSTHLPKDGMRIAVIDDVMTTGATLNEIARTLKASGASHVEGWICARTT